MTSKTYAIFSPFFPPHMGGVENFTLHLAQALARQDIRVVVVTCATDGANPGITSEQNIKLVRLPCKLLMAGRFPLPVRNEAFRSIDAKLRQQRWNGVLVNTRFYPHSLYGMELAREMGLTPVVLDHGSAPLSTGSERLDAAVQRYEIVITKRGTKRFNPDYYGISAKSVEWLRTFGIEAKGVIGNAIDADAFKASASERDFRKELSLPTDAFVVSFVGRLVPEKGLAALANAASLLTDDPRMCFLVAGEGPMCSKIKRRNMKNLYLLGCLETADVAALLKQSDTFCLPTRSEGFATSLLEAAACHTAPIVTDVGGVAELISEPDYGIVISKADGAVVAEAIRELAHNPERQKHMAANIGRHVRERFSWDETASRVIEALSLAGA